MAAVARPRLHPARQRTQIDLLTQVVVYSGSVVLYLGLGALCHLLFAGQDFGWDAGLSWFLFLGWPLVFLGAVLVISAIAAVVFLSGLAVCKRQSEAARPIGRRSF